MITARERKTVKTNRRSLIKSATVAGGALLAKPFITCASASDVPTLRDRYAQLDAVLRRPVLKRELFADPVIIDSLELLRDRNNCICRVRSKDGAEGISIGHPFIAKSSWPMFQHNLWHHFHGEDARDLDHLIFNAHEMNIKFQGVPLCVQIAAIEFAIMDMLGNIAGKPAGQLLGDLLHPEVAIYLGTRVGDMRLKEPELSLELVQRDQQETNAKAIKLRAGSGDNLGQNNEVFPGRTEKLIRMARERFGDDIVLMIDGNGTYNVEGAIRLGKILEEYGFYFYEEPIPWDWYEEQKHVEVALDIPMAGGEEEFGVHAFRYLVGNEVFQIVQPDLFYYGGMIRTMQVARMAEAVGLQITPHISGGGLGYVYMLQMVSVCPAAAAYHEFKMFRTRDANGTVIPVETKAEPFESNDGIIKVPSGSGLGVNIDPAYIKTHRAVSV
jgi:L-alanine-DL-glutamate epimerase-like enolase superfamily enzyme